MTSKLHKPSTAEYGDYDFLANFYLGNGPEGFWDFFSEICSDDPMLWEEAKAKYSSFEGNFAAKSTCDHCGARFLWGCCYLHRPTGELVHVGHICAAHCFDYPSRVEALKGKATKKLAELRARERAFKARNEAFWAANPDLRETLPKALETDHYISKDLKANLEKWGSLSDKQVALAFKLEKDVAEAAAKEDEPKEPVPNTKDRIEISGTFISSKIQFSDYGETLKMLVEDDRGFRVWGTYPSALPNLHRGDRVRFTAAVTRSNKDEYFGFFKRPTKAVSLDVSVIAETASEGAGPGSAVFDLGS